MTFGKHFYNSKKSLHLLVSKNKSSCIQKTYFLAIRKQNSFSCSKRVHLLLFYYEKFSEQNLDFFRKRHQFSCETKNLAKFYMEKIAKSQKNNLVNHWLHIIAYDTRKPNASKNCFIKASRDDFRDVQNFSVNDSKIKRN